MARQTLQWVPTWGSSCGLIAACFGARAAAVMTERTFSGCAGAGTSTAACKHQHNLTDFPICMQHSHNTRENTYTARANFKDDFSAG